MHTCLKYRLHCWSLEHVLMQREKVRMRKVNRNGSYTSAVKYIIWHSRPGIHVFWGQFQRIILYWQSPLKSPSSGGCIENDCSYRVEENETFELIKISSSPWSRSIGEAIGCFRYISFCLRGSLGEERNNKRTTHRTRISRSLFFLC